jgi:hypothetical protein
MARWARGEQAVQFLVDRNRLESFKAEIPAFTKPTFERFRRTRHSAQYFDPSTPPLTASDATWAIEKAKEALSGVKALLAAPPPERFS